MKKILLLITLLFLFAAFGYPQMAGKFLQATLKQGESANSFIVALKSSAAFSG